MVSDNAFLDWEKPDSYGQSKQLSPVQATQQPRVRTAIHARALTPRELEVLGQVLRGSSNKEIAYKLGIANSTVRVLIWRASRRLNATSRASLIERMFRLGVHETCGDPGSPERREGDRERIG